VSLIYAISTRSYHDTPKRKSRDLKANKKNIRVYSTYECPENESKDMDDVPASALDTVPVVSSVSMLTAVSNRNYINSDPLLYSQLGGSSPVGSSTELTDEK
jgi:hypothetical protein